MRIRIGRVIAALLGLTALVLLIRHRVAVVKAWDDLLRLGPGHPEEDKFVGLMALGLVGVCVVAVVRLLSRGRDS